MWQCKPLIPALGKQSLVNLPLNITIPNLIKCILQFENFANKLPRFFFPIQCSTSVDLNRQPCCCVPCDCGLSPDIVKIIKCLRVGQPLSKLTSLYFLCEYLSACMFVSHLCDTHRVPEIGLKDHCELLGGCLGSDPSLQKRNQCSEPVSNFSSSCNTRLYKSKPIC